jgi:hypothetical protein
MPPTVLTHPNGSVTVHSFAEFGYELACIVPFAFWHHQRQRLVSTVGVMGSRINFFFSPSHRELPHVSRHQNNDPVYGIQRNVSGLNTRPHDIPFQWHKWEMPDFRQLFSRHPLTLALQRKWPRLVIVHNKRSDWPVQSHWRSQYGERDLDALFGVLRRRQLHILYLCATDPLRPPAGKAAHAVGGFTQDHRDGRVELGSCAHENVVARHGVARLLDVLGWSLSGGAGTTLSYNEAQYAAHAAAGRFISAQGGSAHVASLFGGVNVIYDVWPSSGERQSGEYRSLFPRYSNATIRAATSFEMLLRLAAEL